MTTVISADGVYRGQWSVPNIIDLNPGYYKERVLADGGTLINEAALNATLTWLRDMGISAADCCAISASWGVKLASDGTTIDKAYSLDGNDFVPRGAANRMQLDRTTFAFPVFRNVGGTAGQLGSGWMDTSYSDLVARSAEYTFGASMMTEAGDNRPIACGSVSPLTGETLTRSPFFLIAQNNDSTFSRQGAGTILANKTGLVQTYSPSYADFAAQVAHINLDTGALRLMIGAVPAVYSSIAPTPILNFRNVPQRLMCGSFNANGVPMYGEPTKGCVREFWNIKRSSDDIAIALARRLAAL